MKLTVFFAILRKHLTNRQELHAMYARTGIHHQLQDSGYKLTALSAGQMPCRTFNLEPSRCECSTSLFRDVTWRRLVIVYRRFDPIFIAQAIQYGIDSFFRNVSNQITKLHRPNYGKVGALSLSFGKFPVRKSVYNMEAIRAPLNVNTSMMNAK
jgi:hypothetical protein